MSAKTALLVMDVQEAATGKNAKIGFGYNRCGNYITNINHLISYGQKIGWEICYIAAVIEWHDLLAAAITRFAFMRGSEGIKFDERLNIVSGSIFEKGRPDSLSSHKLMDFLKEKGVERLVLCGLAADACVSATAISAAKKGCRVTIVPDCTFAITDEAAKKAFEKLSKQGIIIEKMSDMISTLPP
jgi:nicotinamidase-related amidase